MPIWTILAHKDPKEIALGMFVASGAKVRLSFKLRWCHTPHDFFPFQAFDASIRVTNLHTLESYLVLERVVRDTVVLKMLR